jgi:hypothetical protein
MNIKDLIFKFIETCPKEWKNLPSQIRELMVDSPNLFELEFTSVAHISAPLITFNSVVIKYNYESNLWTIARIKLPIVPTPF